MKTNRIILARCWTPPNVRYYGGKKPTSKKKKPVKKEQKNEVVKEVIQAPYKFSADETTAMDKQLRGHLNAMDLLKDQQKAATNDFKLRIENHGNSVKQLRQKLDAGEETRPLEAVVTFDAKRGIKAYHHPDTNDFIREEPMQPADWQLPMFQTAEVANESTGAKPPAAPHMEDIISAAKADVEDEAKLKGHFEAMRKHYPKQYPEKSFKKAFIQFKRDIQDCVEDSKTPKGSTDAPGAGSTNVGAALDAATLKTTAPQVILDLEKGDWTSAGLTRGFRDAAKKAGWKEPQIKFLAAQLRNADTVAKMVETLRPFVKGAEVPSAEPTE